MNADLVVIDTTGQDALVKLVIWLVASCQCLSDALQIHQRAGKYSLSREAFSYPLVLLLFALDSMASCNIPQCLAVHFYFSPCVPLSLLPFSSL